MIKIVKDSGTRIKSRGLCVNESKRRVFQEGVRDEFNVEYIGEKERT